MAYSYNYLYKSCLYDERGPELRTVTLNPQPPPVIDFIFATGIRQPNFSRICARFASDFQFYLLDIPAHLTSLLDTSAHPREAYGHLHPDAYLGRFAGKLGERGELLESSAFAFFLLPILQWVIRREVEKGVERLLVVGLEGMMRVTREFVAKIAEPVAVICIEAEPKEGDARLTAFEQLFAEEQLFWVLAGESAGEMFGRLLAETIGKHGLPSSPSYSPSSEEETTASREMQEMSLG